MSTGKGGREMNYAYTTNTLHEETYSAQRTVSSGIRPVNEKGKFCGPVFLRVKASEFDRLRLEKTIQVLVCLLNRGSIIEGSFGTKTISLQNVRDMIADWGYGDLLHQGDLQCQK
jgi:hypothetical protein